MVSDFLIDLRKIDVRLLKILHYSIGIVCL